MDERALTPEARRKLAAMVNLHREWQDAEQARLVALVRAQALILSGHLRVADVCRALQVSPATWHRWAAAYRLRALAVQVVAEIDTALRAAGADEATTVADAQNDPDLELALGAIGVWGRTERKTP